ncbi:protein of unknown function [Magnetospirillum sp. XM-1]|nr:protein of unknown function [Magnetospirillum sp. XM-1]
MRLQPLGHPSAPREPGVPGSGKGGKIHEGLMARNPLCDSANVTEKRLNFRELRSKPIFIR